MSEQLTSSFIPGAYVIRNKQTSTVLHTEKVKFNEYCRILTQDQDVNFGNQQIWWIEPIPNYEDKNEPVYFITCPGSGKALDVAPGQDRDKAYGFYTANHHGESWQRWKLRRVNDDEGDPYYAIMNVFSGQVIAAQDNSNEPHSQKYVTGNDRHCWEFMIPTVRFPPGWFQIENSTTGNLLSHTYSWNPPVLLPPPSSPRLSEYRESWEFQWTLAHSRSYDGNIGAHINSWRIINRLTREALTSGFPVHTPETITVLHKDLDWELELDQSYNWKLRNRFTSCLLRQSSTPRGEGTAPLCDEKLFTKGGAKSWVFRPMQRVNDTVHSPPEYKTLAG